MKPKQKAPKKTDVNSAPVKRLLKWITTTVSSTGGVTYTQVKNFVATTEKRSSPNFDVKDVLKNFLENGRLQKVGYKYVIPTSPTKRQIAKKTTEKKSIVKRSTKSQYVEDPFPAIKVKRSPGNLEVREAKMSEIGLLEGNALEGTMSTEIMNARMRTQIVDAGILPQIVDSEIPTQDMDRDAVVPVICQSYETGDRLASETKDSEVNSSNVDVEVSKNDEVPSTNFAVPIEGEVADCELMTVGNEIQE